MNLKLFIVLQWPTIIALGVDPRPTDYTAVVVFPRVNDGTQRTSKRMLAGFHVFKKIGKMDDASHVGFIELDTPTQAEFVGHLTPVLSLVRISEFLANTLAHTTSQSAEPWRRQ